MSGETLPHVEQATVPEAKVVQYLLSPTHRSGKSKAAFFSAFGFTAEQWQELAGALRRHAADNLVCGTEETTFGTRYVIEGTLHAPNRQGLHIRSVWFIDKDNTEPRFVTAYPVRRRTP